MRLPVVEGDLHFKRRAVGVQRVAHGGTLEALDHPEAVLGVLDPRAGDQARLMRVRVRVRVRLNVSVRLRAKARRGLRLGLAIKPACATRLDSPSLKLSPPLPSSFSGGSTVSLSQAACL